MVATTSGSLNSLYPSLVIALANAAPYFKNLSINSSARLMQLFNAFSNPSFLLSDEGHPRLLFFMYAMRLVTRVVVLIGRLRLEVFNAVLLRNLADNPNLVYNLVRAHKSFEDLGTFTLARGLREIRRRQQAKEEGARNSSDKNKARASQSEGERPGDEKARLLRSESISDIPDDIEAQRQSASEEDRTGRPLMSPTLPTASVSTEVPPQLPSEKARGKMRARLSESEDMTGSLERLAASGVGRNGFVPTQEWVRQPANNKGFFADFHHFSGRKFRLRPGSKGTSMLCAH